MNDARYVFRRAALSDHPELCKLAKTSRYTRDFSHMMFSGEAAYEKGWIRAVLSAQDGTGQLLGFTCRRDKVRAPETVLYQVCVAPDLRSAGIGQLLLDDMMRASPHNRLVLNCEVANEAALRWYLRLGFDDEGPSLGGRARQLAKEWHR